MRTLLLFVTALAVAACAPLPVSRDDSGAGAGGDETVSGPGSATAPGPAAVLLAQGRTQLAGGEYPAAAATLERALRIEPGDPWLWLELARVHHVSGDQRQAEAHARKAMSLAGGDRGVRDAAEKLLADIRRH
ncbi:MAG: tetratricopeptide repeat protein [Woeseiaceae bacterium]|nr:tetratricopeptide repeat protein [Woeseiaceae bacterium]